MLDAVGRRPIVTSGNVRDRYRTALVPNIFELAGKVQQMKQFPSIPRITHPEIHLSRDTGSAKNTLQDLKLGVNCQPSYAQGSPYSRARTTYVDMSARSSGSSAELGGVPRISGIPAACCACCVCCAHVMVRHMLRMLRCMLRMSRDMLRTWRCILRMLC